MTLQKDVSSASRTLSEELKSRSYPANFSNQVAKALPTVVMAQIVRFLANPVLILPLSKVSGHYCEEVKVN